MSTPPNLALIAAKTQAIAAGHLIANGYASDEALQAISEAAWDATVFFAKESARRDPLTGEVTHNGLPLEDADQAQGVSQ